MKENHQNEIKIVTILNVSTVSMCTSIYLVKKSIFRSSQITMNELHDQWAQVK